MPEPGQELVGRAFQRPAADDRTDRHDRRLDHCQRTADARDGKDRSYTDHRVAGADDDPFGGLDRLENPWRRPRLLHALEPDPSHGVTRTIADEVLLERSRPLGGKDDRRYSLVGHRQDTGPDPKRTPGKIGDFGKGKSLPEQGGAGGGGGKGAV